MNSITKDNKVNYTLDYKLSDHFTLGEFIKSQDAIRNNIDNYPDDEYIANMVLLCTYALEPIRKYFGKPVSISSGYRSVELNAKIGGSKTSDHCFGKAADIEIVGVDNKVLFDWCKVNLAYKQLILEFYTDDQPSSGWLHISLDVTDMKHEALRARKNSAGKTVYELV